MIVEWGAAQGRARARLAFQRAKAEGRGRVIAALEAVGADLPALDPWSRSRLPAVWPLFTATSHRLDHGVVDRVGFVLAGNFGHELHLFGNELCACTVRLPRTPCDSGQRTHYLTQKLQQIR